MATLATVLCTLHAAALDASYYKASSVLGSGRWVKVKVTCAGIHEITYEQLEKWGFSDPSKVTVYGYGGAQLTDNRFSTTIPDDLCQQHILNSSVQEKIFFYGEPDLGVDLVSNSGISIRRNVYSTGGYYFITDSQSRRAPQSLAIDKSRTRSFATHSRLEYIENEAYNPMAGGSFFFDRTLMGNPQQLIFPVENYETDGTFSGSLIYRFASDAYNGLTLVFQNDNNAFTIPSGSTMPAVAPVTTDISRVFNLSSSDAIALNAADNLTELPDWKFTLKMPASVSSSVSYASLDYAALIYSRSNAVANTAQQVMFFPDATKAYNFRISGTTGNSAGTQAWAIDNAAKVQPYSLSFSSTNASGSFGSDFTGSAAKVIVFNTTMKQYEVEYAGVVENQNLHSEPVPDMVIVTPVSMKAQAQELAALHAKYQGLAVKVVTQEEIFNEFSSGTPSAMGIRRYAKMLYDRNPLKFRHLLLFGLGSWDNRHLFIADQDFLITYQAENPDYASLAARCYAADSYFGLLDDDTETSNLVLSQMRVNVGRMPISNPGEAASVIAKIADYYENPPVHGSYNRALLFCDDGDSNDHLIQSDQVADIINELAPSITVTKCFNALYPFTANNDCVVLRQAMRQFLQKGQGYLGYAGHGRADILGAHQILWGLSDIESTDYAIAPFTMLATCNTYTFDRKSNDIVGKMIRKSNGGAIAAIAACRSVYKKHNHTFNLAVANTYFSAKNGTSAGDIYRLARNYIMTLGKEELGVNTLCYNFAGDPALPIYFPEYSVATTKVDNSAVGADGEIAVWPLEPFTLEGNIVDDNGNVLSSFNGTIAIDIYDGATTVRSSAKGEDGNQAYTKDVYLDETILSQHVANVVNGHFSTTISVPAPIRPEVPNRISYYASSNDNTTFAAGSFSRLNVNGYDESKITSRDTEAPVIAEFYINDPAFCSGDEVGRDINVHVELEADASGFNVSGGKIGNGAKLILDGSRNFQDVASAIAIAADGTATVDFEIPDLTDGYHTLEFSIADNADNRSSSMLGFIVVNRAASASLTADVDTPVRSEMTFDIDHTFSASPTGLLVVEDSEGNTVFSRKNCSFPYTWNLKDTQGRRVADGRYSAYVTLHSGLQYGHTERLPFVVIE